MTCPSVKREAYCVMFSNGRCRRFSSRVGGMLQSLQPLQYAEQSCVIDYCRLGRAPCSLQRGCERSEVSCFVLMAGLLDLISPVALLWFLTAIRFRMVGRGLLRTSGHNTHSRQNRCRFRLSRRFRFVASVIHPFRSSSKV